MTQFAIFATLLIVLAIAFILPPLWLGVPSSAGTIRREANLEIFRDQLAELTREKIEGSLSSADFAQAQAELQKRLLEEVNLPAEPAGRLAAGRSVPSRRAAVLILLLLPVLALLGYGTLGNLRALDPAQSAGPGQVTPAQIDAMVSNLAERLKNNPDDLQGWAMLARSYKAMDRINEALDAYAKAEKLVVEDPGLLASYAETLATANGNQLQGKPRQLVERALKLDPKNPHALFLAGAAAMEAGENKQGVAYWQALLPLVEPGSDVERMLRGGIEKMQQGIR